jgi:hypothetical protein
MSCAGSLPTSVGTLPNASEFVQGLDVVLTFFVSEFDYIFIKDPIKEHTDGAQVSGKLIS